MSRFFWLIIFTFVACQDTKVITYFDDGSIKSIYYLKDSLKHGTEKIYYSSGNLYSIRDWEHGKLQGNVVQYYKNGNIRQHQSRANGKLQGKTYLYYPSGALQSTHIYDRGVPIDTTLSFNENGDTLNLGIYQQGRQKWHYKYDSLGKKDNGPFLQIIPELDTLILGQSYEINFNVITNHYLQPKVLIGAVDEELIFVDSSQSLPIDESGFFKLTVLPTESGPLLIQGVYEVTDTAQVYTVGDTTFLPMVYKTSLDLEYWVIE